MDLDSFLFGILAGIAVISGLAAATLAKRRRPPAAAGSTVYDVHDVVKRLPTPQEVKGLTHILEWDPDDFWALEVTAGDGRWAFQMSGDRASMDRRLDYAESLLASQLANFRAEQSRLPDGGEAWQRWEGRIEHLGKAQHRLVPDRRWRRHSLGVKPALEAIKGGLGMSVDKVRIRPLEEVEKEELASSGAELAAASWGVDDDPNVRQVGTAPDGRRWMLRKH